MKMIFLIPIQFMKKNKRQTFSIFLSMILSVAMLVSVSCLIHSAHVNKTESIREQYGDYHYYLLGTDELFQNIMQNDETKEYDIENVQSMEIKDSIDVTKDLNVVLSFANADCRDMTNREIIEGKYPSKETEIALDRYTINLLGEEDVLGSDIVIAGHKFSLCGIIEEAAKYTGNTLEAFVYDKYSPKFDLKMIYLKFNEKQNFFSQVIAFTKFLSIETSDLESNGELIDCVIDSNIERIVTTIKSVAMDKEANFITLLMKLETDLHLTSGLVSFVLVIFSILVIYSIFSVSTSKRLKEYSILQTIGVSRKIICVMLVIEMGLLLLVSYPIGTAIGIYVDRLLFSKVSSLFSGKATLVQNNHTGLVSEIGNLIESGHNEKFYVDKAAIIYCAILMFALIIFISQRISAKIRKKTIIEMMKGENKYISKEKIYSGKRKSLLGVLTNRFMFAQPSKFILVIFSLALGGILIFSTNYIAINTQMNNEMVMHSQEGVSSDIKISIGDNEKFDYGITQEQYKQLSSLNGVKSISGFQYNLGEIAIKKEQLKWKKYWAEIANDANWVQSADIMERFNGIVTENEEGYKIKTNIYGYDDVSLSMLEDYVLEGKIDKNVMLQENGVVLRTIIDAQNNHNGLDIKVGDKISLKTIKDLNRSQELLQFVGDEESYQEKELKVIAIVSTPLITNTSYIGNEGLDIIMTDEQMQSYYSIDNYNMLMLNKNKKNDIHVVSQVQSILNGMNNISVIDNSLSIKLKNEEVNRAKVLIYGIAVLLVIIALFNIINTIFHLLDAKRYSFAVLRAIGITENDFYKMLLIQALKYAFATCLVMYGFYFGIIQPVLGNMLSHVYGYINQLQSVSSGLVVLVSSSILIIYTTTVAIIAKQILHMDIIDELKVR